MAFAAIHIPDFLVQAVVRAEPALRRAVVAIIEGTPPVCTVAAVNAGARAAGIQVGMSKSQAERYGGVEMRQRAPSLEKSAHAALLDVGWSISPRVEDTAEHTIVLDIAGLGLVFGSEQTIASLLLEKACELGLAANVTVAANIEATILGARGFYGVTVIPEGEEAARLSALPVRALATSETILGTLSQWGIRNCGALAALPVPDLSERLGQEGARLHELARGANVRALILAEPAISFEEEMTLDDAVEDMEPLAFILGRLLDQLCARLATRALAVQSIHTHFELDTRRDDPSINWAINGAVHQTANHPLKQKKSLQERNARPLIPPSGGETKFYERTLELPVPMRDSKMLLKLLRLQLQPEPPKAPVKKVLLAGEAATPRTTQNELFLPSAPDAAKLELTIARIASLVGSGNIGTAQIVDTHRPGAFRMSRFSMARDEPRKKKKLERAPRQHSEATTAIFRAFRPPVPARVSLCEEQPVTILFQGMQGQVMHASGPWRTSGDWWRDDAWYHDEWDLEVCFDGGASKPSSAPICINAHSTNACTSSSRSSSGRTSLPIKKGRVSSTPQANALAETSGQGVYRVHFDRIHEDWFVLGVYD